MKTKEQAINLLSYRARSKKELKDRLLQKGNIPEYVDEVIANLEKVGLVNDREFASMWIMERGRTRGPHKLRNELLIKGISEEIITSALADSNISETGVAEKLADKWLKTHKQENLPDHKFKQKLFAFLARRGIEYDAISELISRKLK